MLSVLRKLNLLSLIRRLKSPGICWGFLLLATLNLGVIMGSLTLVFLAQLEKGAAMSTSIQDVLISGNAPIKDNLAAQVDAFERVVRFNFVPECP